MGDAKLYLIDAMALCYRSFYALGGLMNSSAFPTGAIYGFLVVLRKIIKEKDAAYIGVCFDVSRNTFRQEMYEEYKVQRPEAPDEFKQQLPVIRQILQAYNIAVLEMEGFEADDVIATMTKRAADSGVGVVVVSQDKDILQLVDANTSVVSFSGDKKTVYGIDDVVRRYGVSPSQLGGLLALTGDSSDNIPGVPGVGEKTAAKLMREFVNLEGLLSSASGIKNEKLRLRILENRQLILRNQVLVKLRDDVPLNTEIKDLVCGEPDYRKLYELFRRLEFRKFIQELPSSSRSDTVVLGPEVKDIEDSALQQFLSGVSEVGIALEIPSSDISGAAQQSGIIFLAGDSLLRVKSPGQNCRQALGQAGLKKFGYDLKSISCRLMENGIQLEGEDFDVLLAAYLCDVTKRDLSPRALAADYLGEDLSDDISGAPLLALSRRLKAKLSALLAESGLNELFSGVEMPLVGILAHMEQAGVCVDGPFLSGLSAEIDGKLKTLVDDITRISGRQFNLNSPKQLADVLFNHLKLKPVRKTKTGYSTDEAVLRQLESMHPVLPCILEYRQLAKLKSTYVDVLPSLVKPDGKIHASFNQAVTETGRLSSSNPNLQNIPLKSEMGQKIRRAFIPSGKQECILSADYSQIELRILAHLSGDAGMMEAFRKDEDIHLKTASLIYGVSEGEVAKEMRDAAKRINFGIIYGLSAFGLSKDLGISIDKAQVFIDSYFARYPGVRDFTFSCIDEARKNGFVCTLLGRRRLLPEIRSKNPAMRMLSERQAVNTPVQGTAADIMKLAMIKVYKRITEADLQCRMIMQVHDELVFEVRRSVLDDIKAIVKVEMENCFSLDVPLKVDLACGDNWLDMTKISG